MSPEFPLRIIFDDGAAEVIETPEELMERIDSIDSLDPRNGVWVRDALDRSVKLRMSGGEIDVLEVVSGR
jgi:hypothetical protein